MPTPEVVLVSGASGEIGPALIQRLAGDGFQVVAGWRSREPAHEPSVRLDVTEPDQVEGAVAWIEREVGPLHAVVANAGWADVDLALRVSPERFREVVDTDLTGAFLVCRAGLRYMIKRRSGRLVMIGSAAGQHGVAGMTSYSAAKSGLGGLARSLAREVGRRSITVNVVAPGMLKIGAGRLDADRPAGRVTGSWLEATPARRAGEADDVARLVSYLLSPAGAAVTGATIPVDGGYSVGVPGSPDPAGPGT